MEIKKGEISAKREEVPVEGGAPDGFHCERLIHAPNTHIWTTEPYRFSETLMSGVVPADIVRRVQLNTLGLNDLATNVFGPEAYPTLDCLQAVLAVSNEVNASIGLPPAGDLIIRTRRVLNPHQDKQKYTAPALLVQGVASERPIFRILGFGKIDSIEEFLGMLPYRSFLMVHDDNYDLQMASFQGNWMKMINPPVLEAMVATKVLHARALSSELGVDQKTVINELLHIKAIGEELFHLPSYSRGTQRGLFKVLQEMEDAINGAYDRVTEHFGPNMMMEFRRYRLHAVPLQVLDVMPWEKRFDRVPEKLVTKTENIKGD